jgi:opacity protein-like surface antigen
MRKLLLASAAGIALAAGSASAADLGVPTYKSPPVVAPVRIFTWTGCYLGGHVGGGWGRKDFSDTAVETDPFFVGKTDPASIRANTSGFLGGGQVGCDLQLAPGWMTWVAGIQGSGSGADIKGDVLDTFFPASWGKTFHARTDWLADVTGRIGIAWDRFMVYGKGGVAWVGDKYHVNELDLGTDPFAYDASETRIGFCRGCWPRMGVLEQLVGLPRIRFLRFRPQGSVFCLYQRHHRGIVRPVRTSQRQAGHQCGEIRRQLALELEQGADADRSKILSAGSRADTACPAEAGASLAPAGPTSAGARNSALAMRATRLATD